MHAELRRSVRNPRQEARGEEGRGLRQWDRHPGRHTQGTKRKGSWCETQLAERVGQGKPPPGQRSKVNIPGPAQASLPEDGSPRKRPREQNSATPVRPRHRSWVKAREVSGQGLPRGPPATAALVLSLQGQQRTGIPGHRVGAAGSSQEIPSLGPGASGPPPVPILPASRKQASTIVYCSQASLTHCQETRPRATASMEKVSSPQTSCEKSLFVRK